MDGKVLYLRAHSATYNEDGSLKQATGFLDEEPERVTLCVYRLPAVRVTPRFTRRPMRPTRSARRTTARRSATTRRRRSLAKAGDSEGPGSLRPSQRQPRRNDGVATSGKIGGGR